MYFIKRKYNTYYKHRSKLRRNLGWLNTMTQAAKATMTKTTRTY
jgi:hypothetical protein